MVDFRGGGKLPHFCLAGAGEVKIHFIADFPRHFGVVVPQPPMCTCMMYGLYYDLANFFVDYEKIKQPGKQLTRGSSSFLVQTRNIPFSHSCAIIMAKVGQVKRRLNMTKLEKTRTCTPVSRSRIKMDASNRSFACCSIIAASPDAYEKNEKIVIGSWDYSSTPHTSSLLRL
jgi:hypothetical protein